MFLHYIRVANPNWSVGKFVKNIDVLGHIIEKKNWGKKPRISKNYKISNGVWAAVTGPCWPPLHYILLKILRWALITDINIGLFFWKKKRSNLAFINSPKTSPHLSHSEIDNKYFSIFSWVLGLWYFVLRCAGYQPSDIRVWWCPNAPQLARPLLTWRTDAPRWLPLRRVLLPS
jgi:hypothetical protein